MKRFYLALLLLLFPYISHGQASFGFWNPSWRASFSFEPLRGDTALMTMTYKDKYNHFPVHPKLLIKTRDDEVYELTGKLLRSKIRGDGGYIVGHTIVSKDYAEEDAVFIVSGKVMEHVKSGILMLRLNSLPYSREKNFLRKSFGRKLHKAYVQSQSGGFYDGL